MRVTSARGIIAYEIAKGLMREEARRRPSLDIVKRELIREHIDKHYKENFGNSLTDLKRYKLEIEILSEQLDASLIADIPNLAEVASKRAVLITEGAVLPTWVNMMIPFVNMGIDAWTLGVSAPATATVDLLNSLDMFFGAKTTLDYIFSSLMLLAAIPAVGDAVGTGFGPLVWLSQKIRGAQGMLAKLLRRILDSKFIRPIADKVLAVIRPLIGQFKPGGSVYKFVNKMWTSLKNTLPKNELASYSTKFANSGGAKGVLAKMAGYLDEAVKNIQRLFGIAGKKYTEKFGAAAARVQSRGAWRNFINKPGGKELAGKFGLTAASSVDDIAKASIAASDDVTKAILGAERSAVFQATTKPINAVDKMGKAVTLKPSAAEGSGIIARGFKPPSAPGEPAMVLVKKSYPSGRPYGKDFWVAADDLPGVMMKNLNNVTGTSIKDSVRLANMAPGAGALKAATGSTSGTVQAAEKAAEEVVKKAGMSTAAKVAGGTGVVAGLAGGAVSQSPRAVATESVTKNRLLSTAAYLDGVADLADILS